MGALILIGAVLAVPLVFGAIALVLQLLIARYILPRIIRANIKAAKDATKDEES